MIYNFLRLLALSLGSILLFTQITFAASIENPELALNSYKISYQTHSSIGKDISIDVSDLDLLLQENFSDRALSYEWDIYGQSRQE